MRVNVWVLSLMIQLPASVIKTARVARHVNHEHGYAVACVNDDLSVASSEFIERDECDELEGG